MFPFGIIFSSVSIGAVLRVMKPLLVSAPANSPGYRAFSADLCTACRCKMTFVLLWFVLMSGSAVISVAVRLLLMALEAVERATGGRISWYSRSVKSNSGPGTLLMLREETLTRFGSWRPSLCNLLALQCVRKLQQNHSLHSVTMCSVVSMAHVAVKYLYSTKSDLEASRWPQASFFAMQFFQMHTFKFCIFFPLAYLPDFQSTASTCLVKIKILFGSVSWHPRQ